MGDKVFLRLSRHCGLAVINPKTGDFVALLTNHELNEFIERWRNPRGAGAMAAVLLLVVLLLAGAAVVYLTGGTSYVWVHLMYVPIILAAMLFRVPGGVVTGLIAGVMVGPFMPLDVGKQLSQETVNWLTRTLFFVLMGGLAGFLSFCFNRQLDCSMQQSRHDRLTGLPNFLALTERVFRLKKERVRTEVDVALAIIQISNFPQIINTLGYRSLPVFSTEIARRLNREDRPFKEVFCLRDNSFAVLATDIPLHDFIDRCGLIGKSLQKPFYFDDIPVTIDMHIGISYSPLRQADAEEIIHKASIAVFNAEEKKLLYRTYSRKDDDNSVERLSLLGSMKEAIDNNELFFYLQPKVSLSAGRVVGAEALVRWQHPYLGLLSPDMFVPEAEKTWLIHPLSMFAIHAGLDQIRRWENDGYDLKLSINLTAQNIQDRTLVAELINLVKDYGIEPSHLEIEITERLLLTDMDTALEVLNSLRNLGADIAIDDFGSGYSSMNYISKLPITAVKLDQSLTEGIYSSRFSQAVIRNLINVTKELGLSTVAEGVETRDHFDMLAELGADIAQGYYISKPLSEKDFETWLGSCPWKV